MVWLRRLFALHGGRRPDEAPFFVARDRVRPLRARDALTDMRAILARECGAEQAGTYGCHGCRVEGYDKMRRVDKPLAIAQGGWDPVAGANERYDRFSSAEVHDIPTNIYRQLRVDDSPLLEVAAGEPAEGDADSQLLAVASEPTERQVVRRSPADGRGRLGSARRAAPAPASAFASASHHVPAGEMPPTRHVSQAEGTTSSTPRRAARPAKGQRIRVFWTDMNAWYSGTVTHLRGRLTRVLYDAAAGWPSQLFFHELTDERWELEDS